MALKPSTGLRNAMLEQEPAFPDLSKIVVDATGNTDFTDSGSTASGEPEITNTVDDLSVYAGGDIINVYGTASNDGVYVVTAQVDVDTLQVQEEVVTETAQTCFIGVVWGGTLREALKDGVMVIFAGDQPNSADADESAYTPIVQITRASGSFTAGDGQNGINFDPVTGGTLSKKASEVWSGTNGSSGTAGWFRIYSNDKVTGSSTTAKRLDGAIATSGAELNMSSTSLANGATTSLDSFEITLPSA